MNDSKIIDLDSLNCTTKERLLRIKSKNLFRKHIAEYDSLFMLVLYAAYLQFIPKIRIT